LVCRAELARRAAPLHASYARRALGAIAVEHDELVAALQAQHVAQVVGFPLVQRERVAAEIALEEQARYAAFVRGHGVRRWLLAASRTGCGGLVSFPQRRLASTRFA
jgi:hypothetical protein